MKKSGISEKTFTGLLAISATIWAIYFVVIDRPVDATFWAFIALFQIFLFSKREIYDDW